MMKKCSALFTNHFTAGVIIEFQAEITVYCDTCTRETTADLTLSNNHPLAIYDLSWCTKLFSLSSKKCCRQNNIFIPYLETETVHLN
jgi:hypothetical protein